MAIILDPPLKAGGWEVFYKDGSILNSLEHNWQDIPQDDVLGVIIWHEYHVPGCRKKTLVGGLDYYIYVNEGYWGNTNDLSLVKDLNYKRGIWTTDEQMAEVDKLMFEKLDIG